MEVMDRPTHSRDAETRIDRALREMIGAHVVRYAATPVRRMPDGPGFIDPLGMTLAEEAEVECLLAMADPQRDGDEQAAIRRLMTTLEHARMGRSTP